MDSEHCRRRPLDAKDNASLADTCPSAFLVAVVLRLSSEFQTQACGESGLGLEVSMMSNAAQPAQTAHPSYPECLTARQ